MKITKISEIVHGQDGAIFKNHLVRFKNDARGIVYKIGNENENLTFTPLCEFDLDKCEKLTPHSNAVFFGTEYYDSNDEFPLLYTNIYNTYPNKKEMCGVCCVYRFQIIGNEVKTTLVQLLKVGFTDDKDLWRSNAENGDVRPYGNFALDKDTSRIYAFTMRDLPKKTAYFAFSLPSVREGVYSDEFGVNVYTFNKEDIVSHFEDNYINYMQGAIINGGILYSLEGFTSSVTEIPAIRRIDLKSEKQIQYLNLTEAGYPIEPEFIDFYEDRCVYIDAHGNAFEIEF